MRYLKKNNRGARRKRRINFISFQNKKKRVLFAKKFKSWTENDWKRVKFSDES